MSYVHLNVNECCCIYKFLKDGLNIRKIEKQLIEVPTQFHEK